MQRWAIGFVMMMLGLLLTTQFKVSKQKEQFIDPGKLRAEELTVQLQAAEKSLRASEAERERLSAEVETLRKTASAPVPVPQRDLSHLEILAGTIAIQGPGVAVTLAEAPGVARARVSDEDIWRVLNELLAAGAEGLSVNGERITSITAIRNVGTRIMVNQKMTSTPIEVLAVGDPAVLEAALKLRGGVVDVMERWGVKVTITRHQDLVLPALRTPPELRFAKPQKKP